MAQITSNVPKPTFGPNGFVVPDDDAILAGVQADINAAFGGNLNMSAATPQGQLANSWAAIVSWVYQTFLFYTTQTDPSYAVGRMQDALGRIYFLTRNPAEPTVIQCTCVGLAGTVIPISSQIQDTSGNIYLSSAAATIPVGGSITVEFYNQVPGPTPCPANTATSIYKAIPGWDTVNNPADGVIGSDTETREEFEARREASVAANSRGTIQAIQGAVLEVPGVLDAYCYQNDSNTSLSYGGVSIPPNSIYVAVVGGSPAAVAQAIWSKKSPGCGYFPGNTTVTVYDDNPAYVPPLPAYTVTFEIPPNQTIGFLVVIQNNVGVPSSAVSQIQNAIVSAFAGGDGGPRAKMGSTTFASRFYAPVAALGSWTEIISITMCQGWTAAATFTASVLATTMTVTAVATGALAVGQAVAGANMQSAVILQQLTGSAGGTGTYRISVSQTASSGAVSGYVIADNFEIMNINQEPVTSAANILVSVNT